MDTQTAEKFAQEWISSWNGHNIQDILSHYADDVTFYSPFIPLLKFNETGVITNKNDLKKYFEIGLNSYPDLHFRFHHCFAGINTVVIYYTSVNGRLAAEVFELNEQGKAIQVYCNYSDPKPQ
ncbi:nuclear transport factor 2 family protein [Fluviicola sp.]|uniref:nuclear transport factor 2 family protein n=1 Tax=Fluviicola sp. TaxID=1917219 RepID=UPI0031E3D8FE